MDAPAASPLQPRLRETPFQSSITLERLRQDMGVFVAEREWETFHTPRNILLALVGEVGEVAECFQWKADDASRHGLPAWTDAERLHLGEELSDVLLYLVRLSDLSGVDLPSAALRKMTLNRAKYPADKARGRSDKYTLYAEDKGVAAAVSAATAASAAAGVHEAQAGEGAVPVTGFVTPRKGTPAESRTPKESPTDPSRFSTLLREGGGQSGAHACPSCGAGGAGVEASTTLWLVQTVALPLAVSALGALLGGLLLGYVRRGR